MSEPKKHRNKKIPLRLIKKKSPSGSLPLGDHFSWPSIGEHLISQTERNNPSAILPVRSAAQEKIRKLTPTPDNHPEKTTPAALEQKSDPSKKQLPAPSLEQPQQQLPSPQSATDALPPPDNNNVIASAEKKTTSLALTNKSNGLVETKIPSNAMAAPQNVNGNTQPPLNMVTSQAQLESVPKIPNPSTEANLPVAQEKMPDLTALLADKNDFSREAAFMLAEQTLLTEIRRLIDDEPKIVSNILKSWMQENERNN